MLLDHSGSKFFILHSSLKNKLMRNWSDDYWLLILQQYLKKPVGIKPMYSRSMVDLSMELHIHPSVLFGKMCSVANLETPLIERIWEKYSDKPQRLTRAAKLMREMKGFNNASEFFNGVEVNETFEKDFRPITENETLTPVMLIIILDLYFRLTTITMVAETPEVIELARLIKHKPEQVVEVMEIFQRCDPYLNRNDVIFSHLMLPCQQIWNKYGNWDTEELASYAKELTEYFIS